MSEDNLYSTEGDCNSALDTTKRDWMNEEDMYVKDHVCHGDPYFRSPQGAGSKVVHTLKIDQENNIFQCESVRIDPSPTRYPDTEEVNSQCR